MTKAKPSRTAKSPKRPRRTAPEARDLVLAAAESLLLREGPGGLKLASVAKAAGVTNGNVLHHFGTIEGVQRALMERLARRVADRAIAISKDPVPEARRIEEGLNALFSIFAEPSAARLAAWLTLSNEGDRLETVRLAIIQSLGAIQSSQTQKPSGARSSGEIEAFILSGIMLALGAGLFGPVLSRFLGRTPDFAATIAKDVLRRAAGLDAFKPD